MTGQRRHLHSQASEFAADAAETGCTQDRLGTRSQGGGDRMTTHDSIRRWVAEQMHLDPDTAGPADVDRLDNVTAAAEAGYVRALLHLREYRPLVG